jgi:menaquinone-9 beta-reductase
MDTALPEPVVVAQETEQLIEDDASGTSNIAPELPQLYFWPDLMGYGWCVRKGRYLNVGVGRLSGAAFPAAVARFKDTLRAGGVIAERFLGAWKGHAYLLNATSTRRVHGQGSCSPETQRVWRWRRAVKASWPQLSPASWPPTRCFRRGRGVRPTRASYGTAIGRRFARRHRPPWFSHVPSWLLEAGGRALLSSPRLTRHWLVERAFLHQERRPLPLRETGTYFGHDDSRPGGPRAIDSR